MLVESSSLAGEKKNKVILSLIDSPSILVVISLIRFLQNDIAFRPAKLWKNHIAASFGWKTWLRFKSKKTKFHWFVFGSSFRHFFHVVILHESWWGKKIQVSGSLTYNGHGMKEFVPQRTSAYISQHDLHIGELTVRETLAFSARCQGVGARYGWLDSMDVVILGFGSKNYVWICCYEFENFADMLTELSRREKEANIKPDPDLDVYMKVRK